MQDGAYVHKTCCANEGDAGTAVRTISDQGIKKSDTAAAR